MRHPEGPRSLRRKKARDELKARAMTPQLPEHLKAGRPRYGVPMTTEQAADREKMLRRFGVRADDRKEDRRSAERRKMTMSPQEVENWLKMNGISGGDRRKGQRRQGDRRR